MKPQKPTSFSENDFEPFQRNERTLDDHFANYPSAKKEDDEASKTIVVIGQHRYYKLFSAQLIQCKIGKSGQLKAPFTQANPTDYMWKAQRPEELKFYAAITKFQSFYDKSQADLEALELLFKNPARYDFYEHNHEVSEKVNLKSINPVNISIPKVDFEIQIDKTAEHYITSGKLYLNEMPADLLDFEVKLNQFLTRDHHWYLCVNTDLLNTIAYFIRHQNYIRLSHSSFEAFDRDVLQEMEVFAKVHRSYLKPAIKAHSKPGNEKPEKLIYLSDHGDYVCILPVVQYDDQEVPLRSQKQIYDYDKRGEQYLIPRNGEFEDRFQAMLLRQHPDFDEQLEDPLDYYYLHKSRFLDENWFLNAFEEWSRNDIAILGFNEIKGNKFNRYKAQVNIEVTSGLNWFNANIEVRFGRQKVPLKQVRKSVKNKTKYVQLDDGTVGIIPEEWLEKFASYFHSGEISDEQLLIPKVNFSSIDQLFNDEMIDFQVKAELHDYQQKLANIEQIEILEQPEGLNATLRSYQLQGLSWLNFLDEFNFGGCLADDMGLGKSIQIIAFMLQLKKKHGKKTHLLVLPTSLIHNWELELGKFAPHLSYLIQHGPDRQQNDSEFSQYDLVITTYNLLVSDIDWLKKFEFGYVFMDESQNIKNTTSQRYKAARLLKSRNRIVLTGTPLENNTFDLYAQLSFACPGLLGTKTFFRHTWAVPIDKFKDRKSAQTLQDKVAPFILRRTKKEVAKELPEKTEVIITCEMGPEQRRVYDAYEKEFREYLSAHDGDEIDKNPMHALRGITRLRQICNAPQLVGEGKLKGETPTKIVTLMEQLRGITKSHKVLVFSQFVSMLKMIEKELQNENIGYNLLTGSTSNRGEVVRQFQEEANKRVFLISLKAGGTGLNLTAADYVFLIDPWWNPAVENQAIDRVYRIGQEKHVIAARLICPDTVEEKIQLMQEDKSHLAKKLVGENNAFLKGMDKTRWLELVTQYHH